MSFLQTLGTKSDIVADTGDVAEIARLQPLDATTNPALITKASTSEKYAHIVEECIKVALEAHQSAIGKENAVDDEAVMRLLIEEVYDRVCVEFGVEILKHIKGVVSTEVNPLFAFSTERSVKHAEKLIELYKEKGIPSSRVLIKVPATWEGIRAGEILEKKGIRVNMTLIFNLVQASACAQAGAYLVSPFVGRIYDWYKTNMNIEYTHTEDGCYTTNDPGVVSVKRIYHYMKQHIYKTIVMAASFRNVEQILSLSGCDKLTISPALLDKLKEGQGKLEFILSEEKAKEATLEPERVWTEDSFKNAMLDDPMANELLVAGVAAFMKDSNSLRSHIGSTLKLHLKH